MNTPAPSKTFDVFAVTVPARAVPARRAAHTAAAMTTTLTFNLPSAGAYYFPLKSGTLFSVKAVRPSVASSEARAR